MLRARALAALTGAAAAAALAMPAASAAPVAPRVAHLTVDQLINACKNAPVPSGSTQARAMFLKLQCVRRKAGLPLWTSNAGIANVAAKWSGHMAATGVLAHNALRDAQVKAVHAGAGNIAEIVAYTSAKTNRTAQLLAIWMHSSTHRAIILDAKYHVAGVGLGVGHGAIWGTVDYTTG